MFLCRFRAQGEEPFPGLHVWLLANEIFSGVGIVSVLSFPLPMTQPFQSNRYPAALPLLGPFFGLFEGRVCPVASREFVFILGRVIENG